MAIAAIVYRIGMKKWKNLNIGKFAILEGTWQHCGKGLKQHNIEGKVWEQV